MQICKKKYTTNGLGGMHHCSYLKMKGIELITINLQIQCAIIKVKNFLSTETKKKKKKKKKIQQKTVIMILE